MPDGNDPIVDFTRSNYLTTAAAPAVIQALIAEYSLPILQQTTFNVTPTGGDIGDLETTIAYLRGFAFPEGALVTIKLSDGIYHPAAQITNPHPQGEQLQIIGDQANREGVVIQYPAAGGRHFLMFTNGNGLALLDGLHIEATGGWVSHGVWNEGATPYGCGVLNLGGGRVNIGGAVYFFKCYYGVRAEQGGAIACSPGVLVNEAGDVGYHAYNGGHIEASGTFATNCAHMDVGLGCGYLAEFGSTVKAAGAAASGNYLNGVAAYSGSTLWAENVQSFNNTTGNGALAANGGHVILVADGGGTTQLHGNRFGAVAQLKGSLELSGAQVYSNTLDGVTVRTDSTAEVSGLVTNANGGLGLFADGGQITGANVTVTNNASFGAKAANGGNIRLSGTVTCTGNVLGATQVDSFGSFIAGIGTSVVFSPPVQGPSAAFNYAPTVYRGIKQALSGVRLGIPGVRAKVMIAGHSLVAGYGAGSGSPPTTGARTYRVATRLAALLAAANSKYPAVQESQYGTDGMARNAPPTDLKTYDPRFNYTTGDWSFTNDANAFGGSFWVCNTATTALTFLPTTTVDTFEILYAIDSAKGTLNFAIDGAAPTTGPASVNTLGATALGTAVVKAAAVGTHTLGLVRSGANPVYVIGVRAYDSTKAQIDVISGGNCGAIVANLAFNAQPYYSLPVMQAIDPHLLFLDITDNDEVDGTDPTAFINTYTGLVNAMKGVGTDVVLIAPYHRSDATAAQFNTFYAATYAVAYATGCAVLDMERLYGDVATNPGWFIDAVHMFAGGYDDKAMAIADFILGL